MSTPDHAGLNMRGAVDLSALTAPAAEPVNAPAGLVIEATAATFNTVVEQSMTVPVVVDIYSTRSPASMQLSATLADLVTDYGGKFVLARVNADAQADIAQAFGVQSLPTTIALLKSQPVPLFQGAHGPEQIRPVLDELLRVAAENGVTGTVEVGGDEPAEEVEEPLPEHIQAAYDAIDAGDLQTAIDSFKLSIAHNPNDNDAKAGLVQVELLMRLEGVDPVAALTLARDSAPGDLEAQLRAADVEVSTGQLAAAYDRLVAAVRATAGDERERARVRLVDLFLLAPEGSPEVAAARRNLALALF